MVILIISSSFRHSQYYLRLPPLFAVSGVESFYSNSSLVGILERDDSNIALQPRSIFAISRVMNLACRLSTPAFSRDSLSLR